MRTSLRLSHGVTQLFGNQRAFRLSGTISDIVPLARFFGQAFRNDLSHGFPNHRQRHGRLTLRPADSLITTRFERDVVPIPIALGDHCLAGRLRFLLNVVSSFRNL